MSTLRPYMCEGCLGEVPLTAGEFEDASDPNGRFVCDDCRAKLPPRRSRKPRYQRRRDDGCTVTVWHPGGAMTVAHRSGPTMQALREITDAMDPGCLVRSISTPNTILRDLDSRPRVQRGGRAKARRASTLDPYGAERSLLSKIGRLDLFTDNTTAPPA